MTAEEKFKGLIRELNEAGIFPGPTVLNIVAHGRRSRNLNGQETRWRREVFNELGIDYIRASGRRSMAYRNFHDEVYT